MCLHLYPSDIAATSQWSTLVTNEIAATIMDVSRLVEVVKLYARRQGRRAERMGRNWVIIELLIRGFRSLSIPPCLYVLKSNFCIQGT